MTPLLVPEVLLLKPLTRESVDILHLWHFVITSYILKPFDSKWKWQMKIRPSGMVSLSPVVAAAICPSIISSLLSVTCFLFAFLISSLTFPLANHFFLCIHTSPVLWNSSWTHQPFKMRLPYCLKTSKSQISNDLASYPRRTDIWDNKETTST